MKPRTLNREQVAWVAALLLLAQTPLWGSLQVWIALAGSLLVIARVMLPFVSPAILRWRVWLLPVLALGAALAIRAQFGYFVARDPCVAFLYVLVGIKFLESRNIRDGGLLVCLALFLSLTQFFYAQTIFSALMIIPMLLAAGGALAALRNRATPTTTGLPASAATASLRSSLAATGKLLLQGIPLAALMFVLFPRLAGPLWGSPLESGARTGLSDTMAPGSISSLSISDDVAFRVEFDATPPPAAKRYWRGPVFTRFDGFEWRALLKVRPGHFVARSPGSLGYTVTLEPHGKLWLFALEHPLTLPAAASDASLNAPTGGLTSASAGDNAILTYDQQLLAKTPVSQAIRYTVRSSLTDEFPALPGDDIDNLYQGSGNPRTKAFARDLRDKAGSDRAFITAVLAWFRTENFVYTLSPVPSEVNPVDEFLFNSRRGFCEHYSGAFALLLRAAGIPSRVVTGYQGGEMSPAGDYMIVRQSDAHAWTEALLDGAWVRIDPTAAVAPSRIERGIGAALPASDAVPYLARIDMTWLKSLRLRWDSVNYHWQRGVVGFNLERQRDLLRGLGLGDAQPWQIVLIIASAALLWGLALLAWSRAQNAALDPEVALWAAVCRRLARAGLVRTVSEGPLAFAQRAAKQWPAWRDAFVALADRYARLRYGALDDRERAELVAQLRSSVNALPSVRVLRSSEVAVQRG